MILGWPDRKLAPNNTKGKHWGGISAAREVARKSGQDAAKAYAGAILPGEPVEMVAFIEPPDNRWRDLDNIHASLKSYIDGIADAIGFNDHQIEVVTLIRMEKADDGRITIELHKARRR